MERSHRNLRQKISLQVATDTVRLPRADIAEVLRDLSSAEAESIREMFQDQTYARGTCLFATGDPQLGLYLVKKGLIEEYRLTEDGNKLPINRSGPGKFLALASVEGRYCCSADAVQESVVAYLPFQRVEELCRKFPKAAVNLVQVLVSRLGETEERLELLALSSLRARVAGTLLGLYFTQGPRLERITHESLAAWAASSRPKVSLVLEELEKDGLVRLSRGQVEILDAAGLQEWAKQIAAAE